MMNSINLLQEYTLDPKSADAIFVNDVHMDIPYLSLTHEHIFATNVFVPPTLSIMVQKNAIYFQ